MGHSVRGASEFRRHCRDVEGILAGTAGFYAGPELASQWNELVAKSRPNPRPVHVDDQGRVFEVTGERFTMPGLEPEDIRKGLSDLETGKVRPLKDIIASRKP